MKVHFALDLAPFKFGYQQSTCQWRKESMKKSTFRFFSLSSLAELSAFSTILMQVLFASPSALVECAGTVCAKPSQ